MYSKAKQGHAGRGWRPSVTQRRPSVTQAGTMGKALPTLSSRALLLKHLNIWTSEYFWRICSESDESLWECVNVLERERCSQTWETVLQRVDDRQLFCHHLSELEQALMWHVVKTLSSHALLLEHRNIQSNIWTLLHLMTDSGQVARDQACTHVA